MCTLRYALVVTLLSACASPYYNVMEQLGFPKRDILVDRVEEARDSQEQAAKHFKDALENPAPIAVDIPIGLLDRAEPGGRTCDRAARVMLGRSRASSVFTPPTRTALQARTYREAMRMNGAGMSRQAFNIMGKIREVDELMEPNLQDRVFEAHPELAFMGLAGRPMRHKKKTPAGWREREALVAPSFGRHYMGPSQVLDRFGRSRLATDDVLDAYALAITAERIYTSSAVRLPESEPDRDAKRLRMEIWY